MKTYVSLLLTIFLAGLTLCHAQNRSDKGIKVVFVVEQGSHRIRSLQTEQAFARIHKDEILEHYPESDFFTGLLKGQFENTRYGVIPTRNATLVLFTDKPALSRDVCPRCAKSFPIEALIPGGDQFIPGGDQFNPREEKSIPGGDQFVIGELEGRIVRYKNRELFVRVVK
ncbi:MAG: hypothetical protein AAF694_12985 [Bacteroidota bacterium]